MDAAPVSGAPGVLVEPDPPAPLGGVRLCCARYDSTVSVPRSVVVMPASTYTSVHSKTSPSVMPHFSCWLIPAEGSLKMISATDGPATTVATVMRD